MFVGTAFDDVDYTNINVLFSTKQLFTDFKRFLLHYIAYIIL